MLMIFVVSVTARHNRVPARCVATQERESTWERREVKLQEFVNRKKKIESTKTKKQQPVVFRQYPKQG